MKWFWCCFALAMTLSTVADVPIPKLPSEGAGQTLELYRDAANHGSPRAMLALAHYNEFGIGMATNRAEALRWYRGVLTSPSGSTKDVVEMAECGIRRLGADVLEVDMNSTSGNHFLDFIAAQTNREAARLACNVLRHKLLGKTLVFTNMVASYVQHRKDGVVKLHLDIPAECRTRVRSGPHEYLPYDYSFMRVTVFCDGANVQLAHRIDRDDRIARIEGVVVTNWTWQNGMALKGVLVEPQDKAINDALPSFDAANITGDGLLDYIKNQRHIRKWQYAEIQSRLVGRRLTFHNLRLAGSSGSIGGAFDATYCIETVPKWERVGEGDIPGSASFRLSFTSDSARRFARGVVRTEPFAQLDEVTGTFAEVKDPDDGWALQLEDVHFVPKGMNLDITDDGKGPIPGDEIVRRLGRNFTPIAKLGLCSRFAGREIGFTAGVVVACRTDWTSNTVAILCRMVPKEAENGRLKPLHVSFVVSTERAKNLRRTPIPGDLVLGLKGYIADLPSSDEKGRGAEAHLMKRGLYSDAGTIELENPAFSMLWMSDVAKTNGLETKAGERIVRRLGLCWKEVRQDQLLRLAQQVNGKHVDFPSGRVRMTAKRGDGSVLVTVALEDPLLGECVELPLIVQPGKLADQSSIMKCGIRIKNIQGVLTVESGKLNNWEPETMCVQLKDATFEIVMPKR